MLNNMVRTAPHSRFITIGCGNALRSDDATGIHIASTVASWQLPHVRSLAVPRWMPELVDDLRGIETAIFIRASAREHAQLRGVCLSSLSATFPSQTEESWNEVRSLLAVTKSLYGCAPQAWCLAVPGANFEAGSRLTSLAEKGIEDSLSCLQVLLAAPIIMLSTQPRNESDCTHHGESA